MFKLWQLLTRTSSEVGTRRVLPTRRAAVVIETEPVALVAPRGRVLAHPRHPGLRLTGEFDIANVAILGTALRGLDQYSGDVYLDVGGLEFIDVAGLTELVGLAERHRPFRVVVQRPSPLVRRILTELWTDSELCLD